MWRLSIVDWKAGKFQALKDRDLLERQLPVPQVPQALGAVAPNVAISTAMGTAFFGDNIQTTLDTIYATNLAKTEQANQKAFDAAQARNHEKIIRDTLEVLSYLNPSDNLTVAHLNAFLVKNGISKSAGVTRADIVDKLHAVLKEDGRKAEPDRIVWVARDDVVNAPQPRRFQIRHMVDLSQLPTAVTAPQPPQPLPQPIPISQANLGGDILENPLSVESFVLNPTAVSPSQPDVYEVSPSQLNINETLNLAEVFNLDIERLLVELHPAPAPARAPAPAAATTPPGSELRTRIKVRLVLANSTESAAKRQKLDPLYT